MAGFDQAIEKLLEMNAQLQSQTERGRQVAELQAMATAVVALPPSMAITISSEQAERNQARQKAQRRIVELISTLTKPS